MKATKTKNKRKKVKASADLNLGKLRSDARGASDRAIIDRHENA